jgi:C-terminal processing protease CtpA/Prc
MYVPGKIDRVGRQMSSKRFGAALAMVAMLAGCGGDGGGGGTSTPTVSGGTPTPSASNGCTLQARERWVFAKMSEWYLFPDTLPVAFAPTSPAAGQSDFDALQDYLDGLTATARSQNKDRYFTYVTSVKEENSYFNAGASAGFGVRLSYDDAARRVTVTEAFEGAPALAAGIDRGTEILAIGTSSGNLRSVSDLFASGGEGAVVDALGPTTAGTTRVLRIADAAGTREVTVTKSDYTLQPVSPRYGYRIIDDGGTKVGYLNLRTFISTADDPLRSAFAAFKAAGVTNVIVDFRYNGGGLLSTAEVLSDLLGGNRQTSDLQAATRFRPSKSAEDELRYFRREANAIPAMKIAFIGTGATASASEYVINAFVPYLHGNAALVGANTFGKPVGQIALDNPDCSDDRLRVIAFALTNAAGTGDYYNGLAAKMEATCQAGDDLTHPLGDPAEASVAAALAFLAGRGCTPIGATASAERVAAFARQREMLRPAAPTAAQRETPGLF